MDYAKPSDIVPADIVAAMIDASSTTKLPLAPRDLPIRGTMSGALLGAATSLAFETATGIVLYATYWPARSVTPASAVAVPVSTN